MTLLRAPVFSQGQAWLPSWVNSSPFQSGFVEYDTPSLLASSSKDLEDSTMNTDDSKGSPSVLKDVTNSEFPSLNLLEDTLPDSMQDHQMQIKHNPDSQVLQTSKTFTLELELSQTQRTLPSDTNSTMLSGSAFEHGMSESTSICVFKDKSTTEKPITNIPTPVPIQKVCLSPTISQNTCETELCIPTTNTPLQCRVQQTIASRDLFIEGKNLSTPSTTVKSCCPVTPNTKTRTKRRAQDSPLLRSSKKTKTRHAKFVNEDAEAAVCLTVATAETLIIADIMNECLICQDFGRNAILDASLALKRGREVCGLDAFTFETGVSFDPDRWYMDLDDVSLEEYLVGRQSGFLDDHREQDVEMKDRPPIMDNEENRPSTTGRKRILARELSYDGKDVCKDVDMEIVDKLGRHERDSKRASMTDTLAGRNPKSELNEVNVLHSEAACEEKSQIETLIENSSCKRSEVINACDSSISHGFQTKQQPIFKHQMSEADSLVQNTNCERPEVVNNCDSSTSHCFQINQQLSPKHEELESDILVKSTNCKMSETINTFDSSISHCFQNVQQLDLKNSYNSRWLGGWTGANKKKEVQVEQDVRQAYKNYFIQPAISDLSETSEMVPTFAHSGNHVFRPQSKCCLTTTPCMDTETCHKDAVSVGSSTGVQMTLSQVSVKCSLQESPCSFVPCSIMTKPSESASRRDSEVSNSLEGTSVIDLDNLASECFPSSTVKRIHRKSLRCYSTNTLSSHVEAMPNLKEDKVILSSLDCSLIEDICEIVQSTPDPQPMSTSNIQESHVLPQCNSEDTALEEADEIVRLTPEAATEGIADDQENLPVQDTYSHDRTPVTWHRSGKLRLRACRTVETDLAQETSEGVTCDLLPDCSEPITVRVDNSNDKENSSPTQETSIKPSDPSPDSCKPKRPRKVHFSPAVENSADPDKCDRGRKIRNMKSNQYKVRRKRITNNHVFKGLDFLVTGFPVSQKSLQEQVQNKVEAHGGTLLSVIPNIDMTKRNSKQHRAIKRRIVIAPQKVRTLKYLYGCAIGSLIVTPKWVDDCITRNSVPSTSRSREIDAECYIEFYDQRDSNAPIFGNIEAYIQGQRGYCTKLSLLIQHGGGKILQSLKSLVPVEKATKSSIQIVIVEDQSNLPINLASTAARYGLPIVAGDWVIDSLLVGKLLALPAACSPKSVKPDAKRNPRVQNGTGTTISPQKSPSRVKNGTDTTISQQKSPSRVQNGTDTTISPQKLLSEGEAITENIVDDLCISFLGRGTTKSSLPSGGFPFELPATKISTSSKLPRNILFYKSVCFNGIIYSAGDIVEIQPEEGEKSEPQVAQIESFYAFNASPTGPRSGIKDQPKKSCFMRCRWFFHPSDTGFPCLGNKKELYLSQCFGDKVDVNRVLKKVQVLVIVDGVFQTTDDEVGWKINTEVSDYTQDTADYLCRFFYNHQRESLHQLKSAKPC